MPELILTDQNFSAEVLSSGEPVLVDFWAPWCGPCQMLGPIIEELAHEVDGQGVKVGKLNVDDNPETAGQYSIMSIPTLIIFKAGQPVATFMGVQNKDVLKEKLLGIK